MFDKSPLPLRFAYKRRAAAPTSLVPPLPFHMLAACVLMPLIMPRFTLITIDDA